MDRSTAWAELMNRCDPESPVEDERFWAQRTNSPYGDVIRWLAAPGQPARILVTGLMGSGKSTELLRIAREQSKRYFVVHLDLSRAFSRVIQDTAALQFVTAWEVCFLVALATLGQADEALGIEWPKDLLPSLKGAWEKASGEPVQRSVDVLALGRQLVAGAGGVLTVAGHPVVGAVTAGAAKLAEASPFTLKVGIKNRPDYSTQDDPLRSMLAVVNRILGVIQNQHQRVLVVLDGLDRVEQLERARALFIESDLLSRLSAALVVCGPFLPHKYLSTANVRAFERTRLLCEPVVDPALDDEGRPRPGKGVKFFHEVFHKRADDLGLGDAISPEMLDRLAFYSGGRVREFVRLVRNVARDAEYEQLSAATPSLVERVLDRARLDAEEALNTHHLEVLRGVMTDPNHDLPEDPLALDLLTTARLLPFPNGSEWFFPHPLLTLRKLR